MAMSRTPAVLIVLAALSAGSLPARAEGRAEFVSCQATVERAAQSAQAATAGAQPDDATLARCRQIIRDWTLRESRMSVDEQGRPLR
jgi:hypothetical protein